LKIRAIIFDFFGVMRVDVRTLLSQNYPEASDELHDLAKQVDYGNMDREEFLNTVSRMVGLSRHDFVTQYWQNNPKNEKVYEWIRSVRKTNKYKVGLLSNVGKGTISEFLSEDEARELFDEVVLSSEIGMVKPNTDIYEYAAKQLGVKTAEGIMIDDRQENVDGAKKAGMQAVLFESYEQAKSEVDKLLDMGDA
jgi:HAD superfamily hydrolase (TIGR01509 family)